MLNPEQNFILEPRQYLTSAIKRDKVTIWHPLIWQNLFLLVHINNLSNDIVSLVKQKCAYTHILNRGPWNSTESAFLITCIGKIDKFPEFLAVVCKHTVLKL